MSKPATCMTCRHYLGGGCCAVNLEAECAAGGFEGYEKEEEQYEAD